MSTTVDHFDGNRTTLAETTSSGTIVTCNNYHVASRVSSQVFTAGSSTNCPSPTIGSITYGYDSDAA